MNELHVAVVIVTYRSAQLTINALRSIQTELATPGLIIRTIVVDNASGDLATLAQAVAINGWKSWVTLIDAPRNGGFAYGNNLGIERAYLEGPPAYFYLLNPDTEVRSDAIISLVRFLETHSDVGIAGSSIENNDGSDWPFAFRFPSLLSELSGGLAFGLASLFLRRWEVPQTMSRTAQPIDWISGASMMIRAPVFDSIGGLDENYFLYFEEPDFCLRAKKAGFSTWYVPESRIMHIGGQSTKVNERTTAPVRLPACWFESRRRYFAINMGLAKAIVIDIVAIAANTLGWLKRIAMGDRKSAIPHLIRDLIFYSVIWRRNQVLPPVRSYRPNA